MTVEFTLVIYWYLLVYFLHLRSDNIALVFFCKTYVVEKGRVINIFHYEKAPVRRKECLYHVALIK